MFKSIIKYSEFRRFYSPIYRNGPRTPTGRAFTRPTYEQVYEEPYDPYETTKATPYRRIPNANGVIGESDPIYRILSEPTLVIERQIEFMNVVIGFEQANKYTIMNAVGEQLGHMRERDMGIFRMIGRQLYRLHRPFEVDVFDTADNLLLTIKRPFSFINSHIKAILPGFQDEKEAVLGESVQSWHLWRRKYNLFKLNDPKNDGYDQFGYIDAPFLSFDFPVRNEDGAVIGGVDRNWVGLGRELFTDSGVYIIRMDPISFSGMGDMYPNVAGPMSLDQRAVLLGNAVSIDFDYFSRHSGRGGLFGGGGYDDI